MAALTAQFDYAGKTGLPAYVNVVTGSTFQLYETGLLINTIIDASYASGYAGIYAQAVATNSIDNFSASSAGLTLPVAGYVDAYVDGGVLKIRNSAGTVMTYVALVANSNLALPVANGNTTPATSVPLGARLESGRSFSRPTSTRRARSRPFRRPWRVARSRSRRPPPTPPS